MVKLGNHGAQVSVVLPVLEAPSGFADGLLEMRRRLEALGRPVELLVVDDGSKERPPSRTELEQVGARLIRFPSNEGKGEAIRRGMLEASGSVRLFTDGDLPFSSESICSVVQPVLSGEAHIAIGDRTLGASTAVICQAPSRVIASKLFGMSVGRLLAGSYPDTQCGLKAFRGDIAERMFRLSSARRFILDVELLYLARRHNLTLKRVPVKQERNEPSTIRIRRELLPTVWEITKLMARIVTKTAYDSELHRLNGIDPSDRETEFEGHGEKFRNPGATHGRENDTGGSRP